MKYFTAAIWFTALIMCAPVLLGLFGLGYLLDEINTMWYE